MNDISTGCQRETLAEVLSSMIPVTYSRNPLPNASWHAMGRLTPHLSKPRPLGGGIRWNHPSLTMTRRRNVTALVPGNTKVKLPSPFPG